jgi:membrane protease subunit (stomatin/prohibitin family)
MGLLRGMARTAVVAGTATAVSNNVSRRQAARWSDQQQQEAASAPQPAAQAAPADPYEELTKLSQLKDQGIISQEEFDAKKKQLLGL